MLADLWSDQAGMSTIEYAILLMLVALSAFFGWQGLGDTTENSVSRTAGGIANMAN